MKICVYGAGAVGGHCAAQLAASGHEVSVIARGAHLEAIRRDGMVLLKGEQRIVGRVRATERPAELGRVDVVLAIALPCINFQCLNLPGQNSPFFHPM
jgi:2-dehydropantoate 2-reductase